MTEILISTWSAIIGVLSGIWGLVETVLVWAGDVLYHLHTDAPRLEGLLVGIALTWVLLRRDNHPVLRVLSAPLKLVIDILDLAWDQTVEVSHDIIDTVKSWLGKAWKFVSTPISKGWLKLLSLLTSLRDKLAKKKDESED
tara:strand:- start:1212 stop:1634 length:423 start_codon:yes stop_codon:yes gene_type:complete